MTYIPEKRLEALDALMRTAQGSRISAKINNELGALLVKAESQMLPRKKPPITNKNNIKEKSLAAR